MPAPSGKVIQSYSPKFNLSQILQTTLDVYDLIKRFQQALLPIVPFHSFHYHHIQTEHGLDIGQRTEHQVSYQLMLEGAMLGDVYLTRKTPFTLEELQQIEHALSELVYPLRNALHYHEAIKNSYTCALTQVGNRAAYNKAIATEIDFSKRHNTPFSLILIDIDKFKNINDKYGHHAGDQLLIWLSNLISQLNRNTDNLFRYGGEEFALILRHTPLDGAHCVAKRLCEQIEHAAFEYQKQSLSVTISAGVATFLADDTAEKIFLRADSALYKAKRSGRNNVCIQT
ncbi:MAG: GGDEF domain-containing protein [Proteobacteria bacterium]|nr:GGDEF domain-containing protein [Pseudomonadota bacterium]